MRAHRTQDTLNARSNAAVRTQIKAHLGWMRGYPIAARSDGVEWVVPVNSRGQRTVLRLDAPMLNRATRARMRLVRDFPRALPAEVGDAESWIAGTDALLKRIGEGVRGGRLPESLFDDASPYPPKTMRLAHAVRRRHPGLAPILNAMSWYFCSTPGEAVPALEWVRDNAATLEFAPPALQQRELVDVCFALLRLHASNNRRHVQALQALILDRRAFEIRMDGADAAVGDLRAAFQKLSTGCAARRDIEKTLPLAGPTMLAMLRWILEAEPATQRRALELIEAVDPGVPVDVWDAWWGEASPEISRATALLNAIEPRRRQLVKREVEAVRAASRRLDQLATAAPERVDMEHLATGLRQAASTASTVVHGELIATLHAFPRTDRGAFPKLWLLNWVNGFVGQPEFAGSCVSVLRNLGKRVKESGAGVATLLTPCIFFLIEEVPESADQNRFFEALLLWMRSSKAPLSEHEAIRLAELAKHSPSPHVAVDRFRILRTKPFKEHWVSEPLLEVACALSSAEPERFAPLLLKLLSLDRGTGLTESKRVLLRPLPADLIRHGLLDGHEGLVRRVVSLLDALVSAEIAVPLPPREKSNPSLPAWAAVYPPQLHPAIATLNAATTDAERMAARVLGNAFRSPESITGEVALLRERVSAGVASTASLEARIRNLEVLLNSEGHVSPVRLERYRERLFATARRCRLERWLARLEAKARQALLSILDVDALPSALATESLLVPLLRIGDVDPPFRALARRVIGARAGAAPWDLRNEPANAHFLKRLHLQGLNLAPWLDGIGERTVHDADGKVLRLRLEEDPAELLEMGSHFKTCLSPGSCNYFSVFAILADVNKRVLYASDAAGRIVGRCVLALTAAGGIVTFHPYAHGLKDFRGAVREFVNDLAHAMRTVVLPRGEIPCLVAPDWYDDGPHDLSMRFQFVADGSRLRRLLPQVPVEQLEDLLRHEMAPMEINELTLPILIELPEMVARPELLVPLVPYLRDLRSLSDETMLAVAWRLDRAGRPDLVRSTLGDAFLRAVRRDLQHHWKGTLRSVAQIATPSEILRLLRETRADGVRRWADEQSATRLMAAADALVGLGRRKQALELYRQAAGLGRYELPAKESKRCAEAILAMEGEQGQRRE